MPLLNKNGMFYFFLSAFLNFIADNAVLLRYIRHYTIFQFDKIRSTFSHR